MLLKNKVAIITGGGRGLGKAIALSLAKEGVIVILIGRTAASLKKVQKIVHDSGGQAEYFVADITEPPKLGFIDKTIKNHGHIDMLINNAGWSPPIKNIENLTKEEVENCFKTNIFSIFYLLKKIVPHFKKHNKGIIVNISSRAGKAGYPRLSPYSASKFAVEGLTQSIAKELEDTSIKCYSVAPGPLNTPMRQKLFDDAQKKEDPLLTAKVIVKLLKGRIKINSGESLDPALYYAQA